MAKHSIHKKMILAATCCLVLKRSQISVKCRKCEGRCLRTNRPTGNPIQSCFNPTDGTTATEATDGPTLTTTEPSQNSTIDLHVSDRGELSLSVYHYTNIPSFT